MMRYIVEDSHYGFSYRELKEEYNRHIKMTDEQFLHNLPSAIHLACFISWVKELPNDATIGDKGIVHELAHLLHHGAGNVINLKEIRKSFKETLKLA